MRVMHVTLTDLIVNLTLNSCFACIAFLHAFFFDFIGWAKGRTMCQLWVDEQCASLLYVQERIKSRFLPHDAQ